MPEGKGSYGIPGPVDKYGLSDDEEWIRAENNDQFSERVLLCVGCEYKPGPRRSIILMTRDPRSVGRRLKYDAVLNNTCPFDVCVHKKEEEKVYGTKVRFLRHLTEDHMHHHPVYECGSEKKKCLKCNGFSTLRRGRLIEHLKDAHQMSTRSAREKVIALHAKLMDNWHSMKGTESGEHTV